MPKEKLRAVLKQKGLNEGLADIISITDENQIEGIVNQLSEAGGTQLSYEDVLSSDEFNAYIEEKGFDKALELSKNLQKFHDQKVTKGIQTALKKQPPMPNDPTPPTPTGGGDDVPAYIKEMQEELRALKEDKLKQTFSNNVQSALKNSKLPDSAKAKWAGRIVKGEVSIEDQIKGLEAEYNEVFASSVAGNSSGIPLGGGLNSQEEKLKEVDKIAKNFVEKRKSNN